MILSGSWVKSCSPWRRELWTRVACLRLDGMTPPAGPDIAGEWKAGEQLVIFGCRAASPRAILKILHQLNSTFV